MSRCPHCKKLTHSEHLNVYYTIADQDKINELEQMETWTPAYMYPLRLHTTDEFGKLQVGDIFIHFIATVKTK